MAKRCSVLLLFLLVFIPIMGQETSSMSVEEMAKQRQDPVAGLRSIYLQEVLLPVGEGLAQSLSLQPVWPFKLGENLKLITYTIIPFQSLPSIDVSGHVPLSPFPLAGQNTQGVFGLGNIIFNGFFSPIKKKGKVSWGVGPAIQFPTRTNEVLGSSKVSIGPSLLVNHGGDKFSGGFVIQNYWSLGGDGVNKVNSFSLQYFAYYNLLNGWFLESNATVFNNWLANEGNQMLLPVGGGVGKTFKVSESSFFYCVAAQLFYNAVRPELVGGWEAVLQFQVIL